ncbi:MAG TPA: hypothetical protein VKN99_10015 [Polyangia bacterium]|nr:hypothetical protein [Polyangia bacterium]
MAKTLTVVGRVASVGLLMTGLGGCPQVTVRARDAEADLPGADAEALVLAVPGAGAREVPTNLSRVVVAAAADPGPLALVGPDGAPVPARPAADTPACGSAFCAALELQAGLAAQSDYAVRAGGRALDFQTGAGADARPPALLAPALASDGPCAVVHVVSDEPVTAELRDARGRTSARIDVAALEHELGAPAPIGPYLVVVVRDLAGNVTGMQVTWQPPVARPPFALTEVLAHPRGAQPAQEWIEIKNLGAQTLSTAGLTIRAGGASDALPTALIPAGGYGLIVGAGFQLDDGVDVAPAPGAALVRLSSAAIGGGLANGAGAPVELRDGASQMVSRYGGFVDTSVRAAAGTSVSRISEAGCDVRANWRATSPPTPGAASGP